MKRAEALRPLSREHLEIRRDRLRLVAGELNLEQVQELGRLLHDHIRFEERVLFPQIEDELDDEYLAWLAAAMEEAEHEQAEPRQRAPKAPKS